jgi:DNA mismatch repair protein MutS2
MHEIDSHSLAVLEFPRIREIIENMTLSPYGRRNVENLRPVFDRAAIELSLRQSSQMRDIIRFEEMLPLYKMGDISELIDKSRVDGVYIEPKMLLQVKSFIDTVSSLSAYGKSEDRPEKFPDISELLSQLHPKREVSTAIGKAIDSSGEIINTASSALARIRRELGDTEAKLKQHLTRILASRRKHAGWQDDVITIRDGRYVVPVLSGDFRHSEGIVHDKSQSGATLYVEPSTAIPINNKMRQLQQDERLEIDRILRELTAMIGEIADDIMADLKTYGYLDAIHAKSSFALKIGASSPSISDQSELNLIDARHPLLIYSAGSNDGVVPLSINLDKGNQAVLITGPNTGGKTVALKTIGLLSLMTMSGLEIPADHKSRIGIYMKVYADIGDEQSLELSLSTFSSHIRNIIAAINDADDRTLVLFDEIGAGTDPKEGAALAEVIILTLLRRGCNMIATTHYSQLKTLPLENPGLINASLEFDKVNLQPTFRLKLGNPGASYAIDIARQLGFPDNMADWASQLLGSGERSLDQLINKLDKDLDYIQKDKKELEKRLSNARKLENEFKIHKNRMDEKEKKLTQQIAEKYESELRENKKEINRLIKEIRESHASSKKIKESRAALDKQSSEISKMKKMAATKAVQDGRKLKKGETVWVEKFNAEGEVVEMIGDKKVKIAIGSAFMTVDTIDLTRKPDGKGGQRQPSKQKTSMVRASAAQGDFDPELMLRGMTVEEALEKVDKYLDDAVLAGVAQVYIVHGKGTGVLRKRLSIYLRSHEVVDSIRIGDWNEGGHGVTIVRLKA